MDSSVNGELSALSAYSSIGPNNGAKSIALQLVKAGGKGAASPLKHWSSTTLNPSIFSGAGKEPCSS